MAGPISNYPTPAPANLASPDPVTGFDVAGFSSQEDMVYLIVLAAIATAWIIGLLVAVIGPRRKRFDQGPIVTRGRR